MRSAVTALSCLLAVFAASAQAPSGPQEFPADAKPLSADELKTRTTDKVFRVALANGSSWRLDYRGNGMFFINVSPSGYGDNGKWRVEESRLCTEPQKSKASCNDVRLLGDALYLKRDNGEVIKLEAQ
jgi:predicted small lipoprotein YifL